MKIPPRSALALLALLAAAQAARADHRDAGDTIVGFYQRYLKRSPGPREVRPWLDQMRRGASIEDVEAGILGSQEYFNRHRRNPGAWARGLHLDALDREPDGAEVRLLVGRLRVLRGDLGRTVKEFLDSARGGEGAGPWGEEFDYRPRRPYPLRTPPRYPADR